MCHIYFIDDEEDLRIAMEQAFELADIEATGFPDAESALLAYSEDEPPFVVVTDIRLPGINGQQLLNSIKAKDEDIPVILITGHGDISMAVQSMHDGAYDFIEKPFSNDRLIDTVKRAHRETKADLRKPEAQTCAKSQQNTWSSNHWRNRQYSVAS